MKALILNDVHLGVQRTTGATPFTSLQIQDDLRELFMTTIMNHTDKNLIINGDFFDKFDVPTSEVLKAYDILVKWATNATGNLYLLAGNHDLSAKAGRVSSFEFLCKILKSRFPEKVHYVLMEGLTHLYGKVWALPHVQNQDLFSMALAKVLEHDIDTLLLHCNFDNNFSVESDHSLNLSAEWADKLVGAGTTLVIAHEHQKRVLKGGKVYITGNQWASSIADCLNNDAKYAHILNEDGSIEPLLTQQITGDEGVFAQVDWKELSLDLDKSFVRVTGNVNIEQAGDVVDLIAKFRSKSKALVVTNAVSIKDTFEIEDFEDINLASLKSFDVLQELLELLTHPERKVVRELMEIEK